jgi:predicted membrane protein
MKKIATGVIFVLAGVILLFYNIGFLPTLYFRVLFSWQSLLIAIGAIQLADNRKFHNHKDSGIILIFVGLVFLIPKILKLWAPDVFFNIENVRGSILSILIIALGIFFLVKAHRKKQNKFHSYHSDFESMPFSDILTTDSGVIKREYVFTASKERISQGEIKKMEIEAVFSGVEIDFSQAELSQEVKNVHIKVSSVFSGVTLYLPAEWNVVIQKTGVFGGFSDKRTGKQASNSNAPLVVLELEAVFGGGEVKYYE